MNKLEIIELSKIDGFKNHPFKVNNDDSLKELANSIKEKGLLNPLTVRLKSNGKYELISGHRRKLALELIGIKEANAYVKELGDDEAVIEMVDSAQYRNIKDYSILKGRIIVMRTSINTCYERCIKRWTNNNNDCSEEELYKYKNKKLGMFNWYKSLNHFIENIDKI